LLALLKARRLIFLLRRVVLPVSWRTSRWRFLLFF